MTIVAASGHDLQMRKLMDTMVEVKLTIESLRKEPTPKDKLIENLQEQIALRRNRFSGWNRHWRHDSLSQSIWLAEDGTGQGIENQQYPERIRSAEQMERKYPGSTV